MAGAEVPHVRMTLDEEAYRIAGHTDPVGLPGSRFPGGRLSGREQGAGSGGGRGGSGRTGEGRPLSEGCPGLGTIVLV